MWRYMIQYWVDLMNYELSLQEVCQILNKANALLPVMSKKDVVSDRQHFGLCKASIIINLGNKTLENNIIQEVLCAEVHY